jgi:hypothetical protein
VSSKSDENAIQKLSKEFATRSVKNLTQLDDICFSCLRHKTPHVEHCNKCNSCVAGYHLHSKLFNSCIG